MHHLPESRDTANPLLESASKGREEIISSLMNMNSRYEKLLNEVQLIMEQLVETLKRQGKEHKEVSFVLVVKPLLIPIPPAHSLMTHALLVITSSLFNLDI